MVGSPVSSSRSGSAGRCSKVSKLENGKQTATPEDLRAWADATGQPGVYPELAARLAGFESHIRSWRRALANGFKPLHEGLSAEIDRTSDMWIWEESVVPGLMQTPEYARHVIQRYAELLGGADDIEAAVRSRVRRQEWLYRSGRKLHVLMWEAALRSLICPPSVLASQLDRLNGVIGMDTVELGVIPFTASVKIVPANGFWVLDDRLVVAEDWHAERWTTPTTSPCTRRSGRRSARRRCTGPRPTTSSTRPAEP